MKENHESLGKSLGMSVLNLPKIIRREPFSDDEASELAASAVTIFRKTPSWLMERGLKRFEPFKRLAPEEQKILSLMFSENIEYAKREVSPRILQAMVKNHFIRKLGLIEGYESPFERRRKAEKELGVQMPWAILIDVTSRCNINPPCKGCYADNYSENQDPSIENLDKLIKEGKEIGISSVAFVGGEPLLRKKDIIELERKNPEILYVIVTNGTLIEGDLKELLEIGTTNLFFLHLQGNQENTDKAMGRNVFERSIRGMKILRDLGIPFGFTTMITRENFEEVTDEKYLNFLKTQGCVGGSYFSYVPVGKDSNKDLMLTTEQREELIKISKKWREKGLLILTPEELVKQKDACIAGTRYVSITSKGDLQPCTFIHSSDTNVFNSPKTFAENLAGSFLIRSCQEAQSGCTSCLARDRRDVLSEIVNKSEAISTETI